MTGNRDKIRSVFLTMLMVVSVFGATVAFAGTAAAVVPDTAQDPVEFSSETTGENHVEVVFESAPSGLTYQVQDRAGNNVTTTVRSQTGNATLLDIGQDLSGEATLIVSDGSTTEEFDITTTSTTIEDRGSDASVRVFKGETVAVVDLNATNSDFEVKEGGEFGFLSRSTGADSVVAPLDTDISELTTGDTFFVEFASGTNVSMGVRSLGLSVEAEDTSVSYTDDNGTVEATASSNIAPRSDIEFRLKSGGDYVDDDDITDGTNNRTLDIDGDGEVTGTFDVEEGNYTVEVVDIQTGISDETETIQVTEVSGDASFAEAVTSEERGDVVEFTVQMENRDEATINIGGEDVSYFAQIEIVDDDDDGEVVVLMNTFAPNAASSFDVDDDDDEITYTGSTTPSGRTFGAITSPLAAASYDMNITDMGNNEEFDVGTISLRQRSTTTMRTWTAPANAYSDLDEADNIIDYATAGNLTRDSTIANGDVVVQEIQVSGVYGALEAQSGSEFDQFVALNPGGTGDINMTWVESDATVAPNADGAVFNVGDSNLTSSDVQIVPDADNNTLYIVTKSGAFLDHDNFEEDDRLEANFTVEDSGELTNSDQTVISEFAVVEAEADFDTNAELADGTDIVRVRAAEGQNVTGTTSLAPGTDIDVAARATGNSPFLLSAEGEVQPDGTFTTTFDFSNVSAGQNFTLEIRNPSAVNDVEVDAQVAAAATASVTFNDQTSSGDQVRVASASLSEGGFVTIHDSSLQDGDAFGSVLGTSAYLEPGSNSGITVTLDDPISESQTLIAMPHMDTNGNEAYDFVSSSGSQDGPYTSGGEAVTDSAEITIDMATATPTATPEPTPTATAEPTPTATAEPTPTEEPPTPEPTTTGDGAGFGLVAALIALIGAALLAVRRKD